MRKTCAVVMAVWLAAGALGLGSCASGSSDAYCGDGVCDTPDEDGWNCAVDCASGVCGDGVCSAGESTASCPADCYCGNATCDLGEDASTCALDCAAAVCGDQTCQSSETNASCPGDCYCGNDSCDSDETAASCAADCGNAVCPNGSCEPTETNANCPADCYCGNNTCDGDESAVTCVADCGTGSCGDGTCDPDEDQTSCPQDCGSGCVDPLCDLWPQCGCQAGQKCTIDAADNRACLTAGATAHGGQCAADTDCAAGTICVGSSATDLRCLQWCVDDNDCPGEGGACIRSLVDASQNPIPGADMCTVDCDPSSASPSTCPAGWECGIYYVDDNNDGVPDYNLTDCVEGAGTSTTTCDDVTTFCAPGWFCYTTNSECIQYCKMTSPSCQTGTCNSFTDLLLIGTTEYGYCM